MKRIKNFGCLFYIIIILLNISVGAWSVHEILSWLGKSIPIWANAVIGLFVGEFSIPIALVGKILKACGVF